MEAFCPNCNTPLEGRVTACPECGSCEETGWSERAKYESMGIDYDEEAFDYNQYLMEEFGSNSAANRSGRWWVAVVAVVLVILFLAAYF